MGEYRDEFQLAIDTTMRDVKAKVSQWHRSQHGKDYVLSVKSENHIALKKSKYNMTICCCTAIFAASGLASLGGLYFPPGTTVYEILEVLSFYSVIIFTGIIIGLTLFCAFPTKAEYSFTFHEGPPIHVTVYAKGAIDKTIQEYHSLRKTLNWTVGKQTYGGQGIGLDF
ncbi:MAG: hypothetical protein ACFFEK_14255 [Candidatus Thorarchaeota archaeon]